MIPDDKTSDMTVPNVQCVYMLDDGSCREKHQCLKAEMSISYRIPGTHPEEDIWESEDAEGFVKVIVDGDGTWFVADLSDAYLLVPKGIAHSSLRKSATFPCVETSGRSACFTPCSFVNALLPCSDIQVCACRLSNT